MQQATVYVCVRVRKRGVKGTVNWSALVQQQQWPSSAGCPPLWRCAPGPAAAPSSSASSSAEETCVCVCVRVCGGGLAAAECDTTRAAGGLNRPRGGGGGGQILSPPEDLHPVLHAAVQCVGQSAFCDGLVQYELHEWSLRGDRERERRKILLSLSLPQHSVLC